MKLISIALLSFCLCSCELPDEFPIDDTYVCVDQEPIGEQEPVCHI
jgi:hypothetical protein